MENRLKQDFTAHYGLAVSTIANIRLVTTEPYFEIEDDVNGQTQLHTGQGLGQAVYRNNARTLVEIINFDRFLTSLPHAFQNGKKRCDLIVHTTGFRHFLLNELKDRSNMAKASSKAIKQLEESLTLIMAVPSINTFANAHQQKRCCFFNKQARPPALLNVLNGFNRINRIAQNGLQISNQSIEAFGFGLFDSSGGYQL